jgi:ABC-type amino acid transport system permease subunit
LEARKAQFQALDSALAQAVGDAEASVLPLLRNILIMESAVAINIIPISCGFRESTKNQSVVLSISYADLTSSGPR